MRHAIFGIARLVPESNGKKKNKKLATKLLGDIGLFRETLVKCKCHEERLGYFQTFLPLRDASENSPQIIIDTSLRVL